MHHVKVQQQEWREMGHLRAAVESAEGLAGSNCYHNGRDLPYMDTTFIGPVSMVTVNQTSIAYRHFGPLDASLPLQKPMVRRKVLRVTTCSGYHGHPRAADVRCRCRQTRFPAAAGAHHRDRPDHARLDAPLPEGPGSQQVQLCGACGSVACGGGALHHEGFLGCVPLMLQLMLRLRKFPGLSMLKELQADCLGCPKKSSQTILWSRSLGPGSRIHLPVHPCNREVVILDSPGIGMSTIQPGAAPAPQDYFRFQAAAVAGLISALGLHQPDVLGWCVALS